MRAVSGQMALAEGKAVSSCVEPLEPVGSELASSQAMVACDWLAALPPLCMIDGTGKSARRGERG
jgi:hypothetical protein